MKMLTLTLLSVLALAACGGDSATTTTTTTAAGGGSESLSVTLEEFQFDPDTHTVAPGSSVSLSADNVGEADHTWTLLTAGDEVTTSEGLDSSRIITEIAVAAGSGASGVFTAPSEGGIYQVICTIEGHLELGMEGTLVVSG